MQSEFRQRVEAYLEEFRAAAEPAYPRLKRVQLQIVICQKNTVTAGWARVRGAKSLFPTGEITVNQPIHDRGSEEDLRDTVGHELAHIIDVVNGNKMSHGKSWKRVMTTLGLPPQRTHDMDTSHVKRMERFDYVCEKCGREYSISKRMHNQVLRGVGRICGTRTCRGNLVMAAGRDEQTKLAQAAFDADDRADRRYPHKYECGCQTHWFSTRRHNNVRFRNRTYRCNKCKQEVIHKP